MVKTIIKLEAKNIQKCDLRYMKRGQADDGKVTTLFIPAVEEDKNRGYDESAIMVEKTIDTAFDGQMYDCDKLSVDGTALSKDKGSPAQQLRDAFEHKSTEPGLVDFLVESGRPGALHDPLGPKIGMDFLVAGYTFLSKEKSKTKIQYQHQEDGSVIITNESFSTYIDQKKEADYSNYQLDLEDQDMPENEKAKKPQTSLVYTRIVHKVEMEKGTPKVSVMEKHCSVESENAKEANTMGGLLAKKMEIEFTEKVESKKSMAPKDVDLQSDKKTADSPKKTAGNPITHLLSKVLRSVKDFVLKILSKRHSEEPTVPSLKKAAPGPAFFGSNSLKEAKKQAAAPAMPASEAYKHAGFLGAHRVAPPVNEETVAPIKSPIV